ncbi:hypothetical protein KJ359_009581 [Pestalotiopsis sp. 9143b]|nr:hypothetical protein KJ359_009581 [Pestalotiopsis sp. 9143b]
MLQPRSSGGRVLRPVATSLLQSPPHAQQIRPYRFGIWSSCLDPELQKDLRRRQRKLKHKYAESLGRRMRWDQDHLAEDPRAILRRVVHRYMDPPNAGRVFSSSSSPFGEFGAWKTELGGMVNSWTEQKTGPSNSEASAHTSQVEEEYVIDPITNRKVLKKSYGSTGDAPASSSETFKAYRSQFTAFAPPELDDQPQQESVHSNGPPPPEELIKYNDVEIDTEASSRSDQSMPDGMIYSEEYSLNHLPPEEAAEIREDVEKYGETAYDQVEPLLDAHAQKYDDLHKYKPSEYDNIQETLKESTTKYTDLGEYKPYRYNESASLDAQPNPRYDDLHKYRPYMHEESTPKDHSQPKYDDLEKYQTLDQQEPVKTEEAVPKYEDLDKYEASDFYDEVRPKESQAAYDDLDRYNQPFQAQEDKVVSSSSDQYNDLDKYQPTNFDDHAFGKDDQPFQQYGDLNAYKQYRLQGLDSNAVPEQDIVQASLKEFDDKLEARENLEKSLSDHIVASNAADLEAMSHVQESRQKSKSVNGSKLTGNFVRDFPEEFSTKWASTSTGLQRGPGYDKEIEARTNAEQKFSEVTSQTTNASVLETALERQSKSLAQPAVERNKSSMSRRQRPKSDADPYSRQPQGLETSYIEECGSDAGASFARTYGTPPPKTNDAQETPEPVMAVSLDQLIKDVPPSTPLPLKTQPTVYKILAYDPTMQNVTIAETTSVVPDQATPLTPADVLLRLSNPTKFFPHFEPLQAQGFEIVSGSGDVLVFRKIRDMEPTPKSKPAPVNPIDMMGKPTGLPSAAAFASPTGFINYDAPAVPEAEETEPIVRSTIEVRRVPSGLRISQKKPRIMKRILLAGLWFAGIIAGLDLILEEAKKTKKEEKEKISEKPGRWWWV